MEGKVSYLALTQVNKVVKNRASMETLLNFLSLRVVFLTLKILAETEWVNKLVIMIVERALFV